MIFWVCFLISSLLIAINKKIIICGIYRTHSINVPAIIGVLLLAFLAGIRSIDIGTDTSGYYLYFSAINDSNSISEVFSNDYLNRVGLEPGFRILIFLVSRFSKDFHFFCFIVALLIESAAYLFCVKMYKKNFSNYSWLLFLSFNVLLYGRFLNQMRQGLGISIVFLAVSYLVEKRYIKYVVLGLIAGTIHYSAFLAVVILFCLFVYINRGKKIELRKNRSYSIIVVSILVLWFFPNLIYAIIKMLGDYSAFLDQYFSSNIKFSYVIFLVRLPLFALSVIFAKQARKIDSYYDMYLCMNALDLILTLWASGTQLERIAFYFYFAKVMLIADICISMYNTKPKPIINGSVCNSGVLTIKLKSKRDAVIITIFVLFVYWWIYNSLNLYGFVKPIYPFKAYFSDSLWY